MLPQLNQTQMQSTAPRQAMQSTAPRQGQTMQSTAPRQTMQESPRRFSQGNPYASGYRGTHAGMARTQPLQTRARTTGEGSHYANMNRGYDLSGWGEVTPKPFSYEMEAYKSRGAYSDFRFIRPAGGYAQKQWAPMPAPNTTNLGLVLRDTHTLHTRGTGVMLRDVMSNSSAAWKGFQPRDVITRINDRPTTTVQEFYDAYGEYSKKQPMTFLLNRDGRRNIRIDVQD